MASIMPIRRALGTRTLFNLLGPLCNPARPSFQIVGTVSESHAEKLANALSAMAHIQGAYVITGHNGWDEATPICPFTVFEVRNGTVTRVVHDPRAFGLTPCRAEDLRGGDARYNAMRLRRVLLGKESGAHRDTLVLGVGLGLQLMGYCGSIDAGLLRAQNAIDSGAAATLLHRLTEQPREVVNG